MGTVIDWVEVVHPRWRARPGALHLAVAAAQNCLRRAGCPPGELDLVVNAGIYRDRNLGEPALAALIQDDIGANPEDPHEGGHGTFSFDVANGSCGLLTALQIVDGFLRTRSVRRALVVASDADPGHGMSENFPFSAAGTALLCEWTDDDYGFTGVSWVNAGDPSEGETFSATVGFADRRNVLRFRRSATLGDDFAAVAADAVHRCLAEHRISLSDVDLIVAAPAYRDYCATLSKLLGVQADRVCSAEDQRMHTVALAAAYEKQLRVVPADSLVLFVAAGAGVTAGAALYRQPPHPLR